MNNNEMKEGLSNLANAIYEIESDLEKIEKTLDENCEFILNFDIEGYKKDIEAGKALHDRMAEQLSVFCPGSNAQGIASWIDKMRRVLYCSRYLLQKMDADKFKFQYNLQKTIKTDRGHYSFSSYDKEYTYQKALEIIEKVKKLSEDGRLYLLLDFYVKNDKLLSELSIREYYIRVSQSHERAHDIIKTKDNEVGIIVINDSQKGVRVVAGTRKDMALSDVLGIPYPRDIDEPAADYGPHGDWYHEAHKIEKTFIPADSPELTPAHLKMIKDEINNRLRLKRLPKGNDELGYIPYLVVSKRELIDNGFDPERLGWKSLRIKHRKQTLVSFYGSQYKFPYAIRKAKEAKGRIREANKGK